MKNSTLESCKKMYNTYKKIKKIEAVVNRVGKPILTASCLVGAVALANNNSKRWCTQGYISLDDTALGDTNY